MILDQTLFGWVAQEGAQRINWGKLGLLILFSRAPMPTSIRLEDPQSPPYNRLSLMASHDFESS